MEGKRYRESRLCRLLGNPVVYQIVTLLAKNGPLTPARLGALAERSVQTISGHLASLRTTMWCAMKLGEGERGIG
jgi:hypothetical protein